MTLTTYLWASLLICGQSFWVTCVILVEIQPTGINGRAENKIKWHVHIRMNVEWRFTRSFNTTAGQFSGKTNSGWLHITGLCNFPVCPPCQTCVKSWFIFAFGSQARVTWSREKKWMSPPVGFDSVYDDVHSPRWFNLAPEAQGFIDIEFSLSCQGCENVLLQPDGLRSVPAVARLLAAGDKSGAYDKEL